MTRQHPTGLPFRANAALALALATLTTLGGCSRGDGEAAAPAAGAAASASAASAARPAAAVSVFAVQQRDVPVTVEAAGTVVALDAVEVRAQLSGMVAEVLVRDGEFVRRGQPLFRIDVRNEQANADRARAQLLRDEATLADLERQWARAQELRAQNFIAQSAADTVRANVEAQRAAVAASRAALRSAEVSLGFGTITAPLAGRLGAVAVHRGSLVQPGGAVLVGINQVDPIGVAFNVPESQLAALLRAAGGAPTAAAGQPEVRVQLPAPERGRAAAAEPLRGHVVFVDNAVDTATGSIKVKAELPNRERQLWPGQYVTVRLTTRTLPGALVIPQAALVIRGDERSVYVVKADDTVERRPVQTRLPVGEFVVVEGLRAGERVVVEGKQNLRPGAAVRATPYAGAATAGGERRSRGAGGAASGAGAASAPAANGGGGTPPS